VKEPCRLAPTEPVKGSCRPADSCARRSAASSAEMGVLVMPTPADALRPLALSRSVLWPLACLCRCRLTCRDCHCAQASGSQRQPQGRPMQSSQNLSARLNGRPPCAKKGFTVWLERAPHVVSVVEQRPTPASVL